MIITECQCGTVYHIDSNNIKPFQCKDCKRKIVPSLVIKQSQKENIKEKKALTPEQKLDVIPKWLFLFGTIIGLFSITMIIPTVIIFKNSLPTLIFLSMIEFFFGVLLVSISFSLYLITLQIKNLQATIQYQQHNLNIFADQISKLYAMFRRDP